MKDLKALFFRDWDNDYVAAILKEIFWEKIYDPYKKEAGTVVDVGANIGLFTFYAYPWASKIYAIEPSQEHYDTLMHLLAFNHMEDKVMPLQVAISGEEGQMTLHHSQNTTMYSLNPAVQVPGLETEQVNVITLPTLFSEQKIDHVDLLKMDTEGEEFKIFASKSFDDVSTKIDTIVVEYHAWTQTNPDQLALMLKDRGYRITKVPTDAMVYVAQRS